MFFQPPNWQNPALPATQGGTLSIAPANERIRASVIDDCILGGIWVAGWMLGVVKGAGILYLLWLVNAVVAQGITGFTAGKKMAGLQMVNSDTGEPIGIWRKGFHTMAWIMVLWFTLGIGILMMLFDSRSQTLADRMFRVVVVKVE
jgi:hypothetical protein